MKKRVTFSARCILRHQLVSFSRILLDVPADIDLGNTGIDRIRRCREKPAG
jgi:hypothetical protein